MSVLMDAYRSLTRSDTSRGRGTVTANVMTNLERLEKLIMVMDNYRSQLIIDGHQAWADKIAYILDELMWLYYDMDQYS